MTNLKPTKPCDRCGKPRYWRAKTGLHRLIDWLLAPAFRWAGKRWED